MTGWSGRTKKPRPVLQGAVFEGRVREKIPARETRYRVLVTVITTRLFARSRVPSGVATARPASPTPVAVMRSAAIPRSTSAFLTFSARFFESPVLYASVPTVSAWPTTTNVTGLSRQVSAIGSSYLPMARLTRDLSYPNSMLWLTGLAGRTGGGAGLDVTGSIAATRGPLS